MKTFKTYLHKDALPEIYLDMNGVIVDWNRGANKVLESYGYPEWENESWNQFDSYQRDEIRWSLLKKQEMFWGNLPVMKEGKKLWRFVEPYSPNILTSIGQRMRIECIQGKKHWLNENLQFKNFNNVYFVEKFTKQKYAKDVHGRANILIDECAKNCELFESAGGVAILHVSVPKTISELRKIGFKTKRKKRRN